MYAQIIWQVEVEQAKLNSAKVPGSLHVEGGIRLCSKRWLGKLWGAKSVQTRRLTMQRKPFLPSCLECFKSHAHTQNQVRDKGKVITLLCPEVTRQYVAMG